MKHVFEWMGGVPRKIWFDNLSAAVVSIGLESIEWTREIETDFVRIV
jgi:transposase